LLLLVGLGNPGAKYAGNRHNIGFMAADDIVRRHGFSAYRASKFHGDVAEGTIAGEKVLVLKPTTYMNESGRAVSSAVNFYKLTPADVVVLHDEMDLPQAKVRVKVGGGHAGHNGIRSIAAHIGADFKRVRLGVGHPGEKDKVVGHVLKDFSKADQVWLTPLLDAIADSMDLLVKGDDSHFMSRIADAVKKD